MHGCGWDSGAARERSSALAASVASRYELGADGVGAARPGARGRRVTASRYALGAEGGGAARPGAYMCPPRNCARCLLGGEALEARVTASRSRAASRFLSLRSRCSFVGRDLTMPWVDLGFAALGPASQLGASSSEAKK